MKPLLNTSERKTLRNIIRIYEKRITYTKGVALSRVAEELSVLRKIKLAVDKSDE